MIEPISLFAGYEPLESLGFSVFTHSVISRSSRPVSITALSSLGLPRGSNAFSMSRFLVPWIRRFKGHSIFMDASDQLMLDDIAKLDELFDPRYAVQCVKHPEYKTRHPVKYRGTKLQCENRDYARKNWASVFLVNNEHPAWAHVDPEYLMTALPLSMLQFLHIDDDLIGEIDPAWNVLIDEGQEGEGASLLHWSSGIPAFPMYQRAPGHRDWEREREAMEACTK